MTRSPHFKLRSACAHLVTLCLSFSLLANPVWAQGAKKATAPAAAAQPQANDKDYTDSILKNTTDKQFLTELVDHLPASDKVPTPAKIIGYPVGTPNKLTYTKDQYRYYRELEKATPRVKVFTAPEKSELGREQLLIAVGDEDSILNPGDYCEALEVVGNRPKLIKFLQDTPKSLERSLAALAQPPAAS